MLYTWRCGERVNHEREKEKGETTYQNEKVALILNSEGFTECVLFHDGATELVVALSATTELPRDFVLFTGDDPIHSLDDLHDCQLAIIRAIQPVSKLLTLV